MSTKVQKIDFTKQIEDAMHQHYQQQMSNAMKRGWQARKKRITRQVRMSVSNAQKLKLRAAEEEMAMSELLDEIVEGYLNPKKEVSTK